MPEYRYQSREGDGPIRNGLVSSESPRRARDELRRRGLTVTSLREVPSRRTTLRRVLGARRRLPQLISDLATLLAVDVPLVQALTTLADQHPGAFGRLLAKLRDQVAEGRPFAAAIESHGVIFDPLTVAMVRVGEATGRLDDVLRRAAEFLQRQARFRDRVASSLMYPAIVSVACVAVSVFLLTFVMPLLVDNLVDLGREIPWPTRLLRRGGELLQGYWLPISLTGIVTLALGYRSYCTVAGRRRFERWLLRLPLVGVMRQRQELSRAASVLATLLESGIVLEQALELVERTSRNPLLTDALAAVRRRITEGSDLGRAVGAERYFPAVFAHVFSIGQESGQLETLLRRIAEDYDRQVDTLATRLSAVLEPTMILILTVVVGFIMFATLLPILESGNVL